MLPLAVSFVAIGRIDSILTAEIGYGLRDDKRARWTTVSSFQNLACVATLRSMVYSYYWTNCRRFNRLLIETILMPWRAHRQSLPGPCGSIFARKMLHRAGEKADRGFVRRQDVSNDQRNVDATLSLFLVTEVQNVIQKTFFRDYFNLI